MTSDLLGLLELLLVLGIVLGVAVFELVSLKRARRRETALKASAREEAPTHDGDPSR